MNEIYKIKPKKFNPKLLKQKAGRNIWWDDRGVNIELVKKRSIRNTLQTVSYKQDILLI